jgi:hypothetical protein
VSETIDVLGLCGPNDGFSAHTNSTKFRCVHLAQLFWQTSAFQLRIGCVTDTRHNDELFKFRPRPL